MNQPKKAGDVGGRETSGRASQPTRHA